MKQMIRLRFSRGMMQVCIVSFFIFFTVQGIAQKQRDWRLEKMPGDLELDFALSALPRHLRADATVYLLDPDKGYYIARRGSNGFIFIN